ncbi:MAG: MoxR family ATPase [Coprothermobacterota bacterium]|jgi:MoxR-like ATPase|nr:MoxR family ATPase [Caldisericota bacterium]MDI6869051.1 MoxR family ATPase [Coprothermobacterota bacterium]
MLPQEVQNLTDRVLNNVEKVIVSKKEAITMALAAVLAGGHILVEDVPGVGKTMLCRSLARSFGCNFQRIQFTPDLLPSDILGLSVFNMKTQQFEFKPGPIFTHFLLADEINRATPKTQSALLEAMGERQVTIDGVTYHLEEPFVVMATQNPIEYEGTFPLPEAQLDRFIIRLKLGYPEEHYEQEMLQRLRSTHPIYSLEPVANQMELQEAQRCTREVFVDETVYQYIVSLVGATRKNEDVYLGASPRGSIALLHLSQALAVMQGRNYVAPDDVKLATPFALPHRILLKTEARLRGETSESVIEKILNTTPINIGT